MNKFEKRSRESYNEKAMDYDNTPEGRFTAGFQALLCDRVVVPTEGKLLDVACGNGSLLKKLATSGGRKFAGFGVDIAENMISCAKERNPDMAFYVAGCDNLPFEAASMDAITVSAAFHHFPAPKVFAKEAARVLKPGGQLYLAEMDYPAVMRLIGNLFLPLSSAGDVKCYAPTEIKCIFERAGFVQKFIEIRGQIQLHIFQAAI